MEERVIRAVPWAIVSYGGNLALRLATTVVLARILVPTEFGLFALAALVTTGLLTLLAGLGLDATLVVRRDLTDREAGTILTLLGGQGVALALLIAALAPLTAIVFGEPSLAGIQAVLGISAALASLSIFYESVMQRELRYRSRFAAQTVQSLVYAAVAIPIATGGAGAWSLVAGQVVGALAYAIALERLSPYRVRPSFDPEVARGALSTGRAFMFQGGLGYVQTNFDYAVVGAVLGAKQLGFYSMAYRLSETPYLGIANQIARVSFPGFVRMTHRGEEPTDAFLSGLRLVALVTCPIGVLLSGAAEPFTRAIFGDKWLLMIGPLAVLGIGTGIRSIQVMIGWFLNSLGHQASLAWVSVALFVPLVPVAALAAHWFGITGVAYTMLGEMTLALLAFTALASARTPASVSQLWASLRPVVLACALAWLASRGLSELLDDEAPGLTLAAAVLAGTGVYVLAILVTAPGLFSSGAALVRRAVARGPQDGESA